MISNGFAYILISSHTSVKFDNSWEVFFTSSRTEYFLVILGNFESVCVVCLILYVLESCVALYVTGRTVHTEKLPFVIEIRALVLCVQLIFDELFNSISFISSWGENIGTLLLFCVILRSHFIIVIIFSLSNELTRKKKKAKKILSTYKIPLASASFPSDIFPSTGNISTPKERIIPRRTPSLSYCKVIHVQKNSACFSFCDERSVTRLGRAKKYRYSTHRLDTLRRGVATIVREIHE